MSNRAQPRRNPKGPPSEAPRAPAPPPPPPIFDALVRCATTSLRYVRWRGATSPTRDSSFFTAYTPLRYRYAVFLSRHLARQISALTQVQLAASVRSSSSGCAPRAAVLLHLACMTAAHIYTAASCSAATHSGPSGSSALWSEAGLRQVRGKQPFRYCLLIDCIRPHPRLLASGRSPQCIEGISFTKSFTLQESCLAPGGACFRELTSMPQSPQPLTAMRSRCAEMASIFGLAWRLARRLRALAR